MMSVIRCGGTFTIEIHGHRKGVKAYLWENHHAPGDGLSGKPWVYRTLEDTAVAETEAEALRRLEL